MAQGRAQAGDRALPEGHQPAQGRAALPGAGAPVRGGRLALHARRRQHARHLRVREGAAPRRADGGDAGRQPRARNLRPRVRPHRRHREGAREPRALGRAGPRLRPGRDDPRAAHARPSPRGLGGRLQRRRRRLRRGPRAGRQIGELPAQVELHAALAQLAVYRADWDGVRDSTEASADLAEREGLVGKLCFPYVLRGMLAWREGNWDARRGGLPAGATSWPTRSAGPRSRSRRSTGSPHAARPGRLRRRRHRARPRARRLRARGPDRAVDRGDVGAGRRAGDGRQGRPGP